MKSRKLKMELIEDYVAIINIDNFNLSIETTMNQVNANDQVFLRVKKIDENLKNMFESLFERLHMMDLSLKLLKKEIYSTKFPINDNFFLKFAITQNNKNLEILRDISSRIKEKAVQYEFPLDEEMFFNEALIN